MPIRNREDAVEVEERISRIFAATPEERAADDRKVTLSWKLLLVGMFRQCQGSTRANTF